MSTPNIKMVRVPKPDDFCKVDDLSAKPCECTEDMKAGLGDTGNKGDGPICKPCAARRLLNGIASLADTLS